MLQVCVPPVHNQLYVSGTHPQNGWTLWMIQCGTQIGRRASIHENQDHIRMKRKAICIGCPNLLDHMIQALRTVDLTGRGRVPMFLNPRSLSYVQQVGADITTSKREKQLFTNPQLVRGLAKGSALACMNAKPGKADKINPSAQLAYQGEHTANREAWAVAWDLFWKAGFTPWDLKGVTPVVSQLLEENKIPDGLGLVPGCGSGYDVLAMASQKRHVIGLDYSSTALEQAQRIASSSPNSKFAEFQNADFFTYASLTKFDFMFDYNFFCSIDGSWRPDWAKKVAELLATNGELITVIYPLGDSQKHLNKVSLVDYENVLLPYSFEVVSHETDIPSVPSRKGQESLVRWRRKAAKL